MDRGNESFPSNNNLFADNQQYNAYESMNFLNGNESAFPNPAYLNANPQSYGLQNGAHLASTNAHHSYNGQSSPYGQSTNHSSAPFNQNAFNNFSGQQNFPYRQPQQYDPSLLQTVNNGQTFSNPGTIAPQALEHETSPYGNPYAGSAFSSTKFNNQNNQARHNIPAVPLPLQQRPVDQHVLAASIPHGADAGMFSIIKFDDLARATKSERMGNFVNVGNEPLEWDCTRSAVPAYASRKSRNELRALAGNNANLLAKIGKKSMKNKTLSASSRGIKASTAGSSTLGAQIKYEQYSSSEEESSDDDSAYSDDDESDSPLPDKRPEDSKGAVEYDTIRALWRSKRRDLDGAIIRKGLTEFWEIVKTIRDRWKADAAAVNEAEEKKRVGELPLLKSRVKDQRDMIEAAFRAALKHGHRDIIALLAENVSLAFVCYQVLLDRFKNDDFNCGVVKAILETMVNWTTLTDEKVEKTQLSKMFPRYLKKGDARVQFMVKKILANTAQATKEVAMKGEHKKPESASAQNSALPATKRAVPDPVAGVKRPAATPGDGSAPKKTAIGAGKSNIIAPTAKANGVAKKSSSAINPKPSAASASVAAVRRTVTPKPSNYFNSLQSASKKPGTSIADRNATTTSKQAAVSRPLSKSAPTTIVPAKPTFSFAETMANLARPKEDKPSAKPQVEEKPESAEERKKRLHKEQRRKLRVRFAERDQLEQIRFFQSDPNEENGHDSSQLRDMSDIGGEGRVLKQHRDMMDLDDEDDATDEVETLINWRTPSGVDFSVVEADERARNYAPYGGGELQPDSPERAVRENYENNTLLVFYTDSSEIPPNPRELADTDNGEEGGDVRQFGAPEEKFAARARTMRAQQIARQSQYGQKINANALSASTFAGFINHQPQQQHAPPGAPDIQSILASLQAQGNYAQPQQAGAPYHQSHTNGQPTNNFQHAPAPAQQQAVQAPPAGIDLAAILAAINPQQQTGYHASAAPAANFPPQAQQQQASMFAGSGTNFAQQDPAQNPFYKTKVCRFFQDGRCTKGDKCSYLHE